MDQNVAIHIFLHCFPTITVLQACRAHTYPHSAVVIVLSFPQGTPFISEFIPRLASPCVQILLPETSIVSVRTYLLLYVTFHFTYL